MDALQKDTLATISQTDIQSTIVTPENIEAAGSVLRNVLLIIFGFILLLKYGPSLIAYIKGLLDRVKFQKTTTIGVAQASEPTIEEAPAAAADLARTEEMPKEQAEEPTPEIEEKKDEKWFPKLIEAMRERDLMKLEEAYQHLSDAEDDDLSKLKLEALYQHARYRCGDRKAAGILQELTKNEHVRHKAYWYLALIYEMIGDFSKAAEAFDKAAKTTDDPSDRGYNISRSAGCLFKAGQLDKAFNRIGEGLSNESEPAAITRLYVGLAELYDLANEKNMKALALEKALEFESNNVSYIFDAAYSFSDQGFEELSLLHYDTLLRFDPTNAHSLNNIGVQYQQLDMPIKAVSSYNKSAELGNTLAMANLARKLISEGFIDEAKAKIEKAKAQDKMHPNVGEAISRIEASAKEEDEKEQRSLKVAREHQDYLSSFCEVYFVSHEQPPAFEGDWKNWYGHVLPLRQDNKDLLATWEEGGVRCKLEGKVKNRGARIKFYRWGHNILLGMQQMFLSDGDGFAFFYQRTTTR